MYCSRCGKQISEELNFCSQCGERVNKNELTETSKTQSEMLDNLAITAIFIGVGGLLFLVGLVAVLLDKPLSTQVIILIVIAYLGAWLGVCLKLLGQISKIVDANLKDRKPKDEDFAPQPARLAAPTTAQLEEHREPALSVTENTTKTLDEVLVERKN